MPKLSIVSGTYNRLSLLQNMVDSVRRQLPPGLDYEFVLVDGGSSDGTILWARAQADVVLIEHGELRGAIAAFCEGARAATGKYVVLANDDVTFEPGGLLRALCYLEDTPDCGAVAFADDRPALGKTGFRVEFMPARINGSMEAIHYAQVGMFRKWLGDTVGWWGVDDPDFPARTYAGDNYLTARIVECGYTVDAVARCHVKDTVYQDALRTVNGGDPQQGSHPDSAIWDARFPGAVIVGSVPKPPQQDKTSLRVVYLPIYEPGHAVQKAQKRGLRDALKARGAWVAEVDYLAIPPEHRVEVIAGLVESFQPHLLISQIHGHDVFSENDVRIIRSRQPRMVWVNWNGDVHEHGLTGPQNAKLLREFDLQLTVNARILRYYQQAAIPAAYWQIGFETGAGHAPDQAIAIQPFDVVFLASAYDAKRKRLEAALAGVNAGFYGSGWQHSRGVTLYDFATGNAILQQAKIALSDDLWQVEGFVSNRFFQTLAAGGAMLLQQRVPELDEWVGCIEGEHYIAYEDETDLVAKIDYYLNHEDERAAIATAGYVWALQHASFEARVHELYTSLLGQARRMPQKVAAVRYKGHRNRKGGITMPMDGYQYSFAFRHGDVLHIDPLHLPHFLRDSELWERVEDEQTRELVR